MEHGTYTNHFVEIMGFQPAAREPHESPQVLLCGLWPYLYMKHVIHKFINLKAKCNMLYISNQAVPRCKHFPPRL
jgi:hypothetical protein